MIVQKSVPSLPSQISLIPHMLVWVLTFTEAMLKLKVGYKSLKERGERISTQ